MYFRAAVLCDCLLTCLRFFVFLCWCVRALVGLWVVCVCESVFTDYNLCGKLPEESSTLPSKLQGMPLMLSSLPMTSSKSMIVVRTININRLKCNQNCEEYVLSAFTFHCFWLYVNLRWF